MGKAAAFIVDPRDPRRHLEEATVLLASIVSVGDLDLSLSKNDRKRLNRIVAELSDPFHQGRLPLDQVVARKGLRNLTLLTTAAALSG